MKGTFWDNINSADLFFVEVSSLGGSKCIVGIIILGLYIRNLCPL